MSDLNDLNFNANEVEPQSEYTPLPSGEYDVAIIDAEVKPTANGLGKYLKLVYQVTSGEFQNRQHFENLNLWNANTQTVEIAKASLSAICRAVGVLTPKDSQELVGKTMTVKMSVKERKDQPGTYQNRVTKYSARNNGGEPQAAAKAPAKNAGGW